MLGVTIFGIFLTPVFFYVIEGIAESPVFSCQRARSIGRVLWLVLGVATFGLLWLPRALSWGLRRSLPAPEPAAARNGLVSASREGRKAPAANGHSSISNGAASAAAGSSESVLHK
jgi:hypothetical protein